MTRPRFKCDCCGLCCRAIGGIPQLKQFDRGDGVCCHLTDANLCDMYNKSRPEVYSVEKMYSRFASEMSREEYYALMTESCAVLKHWFQDGRNREPDSDETRCLLGRIPRASLIRLMRRG